jgi:hypothetical protein
MPAGKSPNNAFNLHNDQMQGCFYTIRRDRFDWIRYPCEELDREISKTFFYWEKCENTGIYYLYSKEGDSGDVDLVQRREGGSGIVTKGMTHCLPKYGNIILMV